MHNEWIANRRTEFVELKSDLLGFFHLDAEQATNSAPRFCGHPMGEHRRSFLGEFSLLFFREVMAQYFQDEISVARNGGLESVGSTRLR